MPPGDGSAPGKYEFPSPAVAALVADAALSPNSAAGGLPRRTVTVPCAVRTIFDGSAEKSSLFSRPEPPMIPSGDSVAIIIA